VDWFLEWQGNITRAAEGSGGYCGTDVFQPSDGQQQEWVVAIHFEDEKALDHWLDSPVRDEWLTKLRNKIGNFDLKKLPGGFGPWFTTVSAGQAEGPPSWKMALSVLLGLFPTVMVLTILVGPYTSPWGLALSMLIGNALSISILQWGVMPVLTRVLGPWLNANGTNKKALTFAGLLGILLLLMVLVALFRQITG